MPDPGRCDRRASGRDYVFNRNGVPGVKREWWCHVASGVWFIAERDTARDEVLRTYLCRATARMMHRLPHVAGEWIDRATAAALQLRGPRATRASPATR